MKKDQKKKNGSQPATQDDLALWGGELSRRIDTLDNRMGGIETRMDGLENRMGSIETQMSGMRDSIDTMEDRIANRVMTMMQAYNEQLMDTLQGKHQDELDIVAGNKDAPASWKSIPRRLTTVEKDVETIKDTLAQS